MAATTRDALGPSARVVVRETRSEPSDVEALAERGRTIGFAIASILPEAPTEGSEPSTSNTTAPPAVGTPASRSAPEAGAATPATGGGAAQATGGAAQATGGPTPAPVAATPGSATADGPSPASKTTSSAVGQTTENVGTAVEPTDANAVAAISPLIAIDVLSIGTAGIGGDADGFGAGTAVHRFVRPQVSARLGGGIRGGTLGAAEASTLTAFVSAGVVLHAWRATPDRPFGGSVRLDYLLLNQAMTHFVPGGSNQSQARWLSGLDVLVDGSWRFVPDVEAILGVGLEDVFAPTYVNLQGARVATLPALRAVAEAGLRLRF